MVASRLPSSAPPKRKAKAPSTRSSRMRASLTRIVWPVMASAITNSSPRPLTASSRAKTGEASMRSSRAKLSPRPISLAMPPAIKARSIWPVASRASLRPAPCRSTRTGATSPCSNASPERLTTKAGKAARIAPSGSIMARSRMVISSPSSPAARLIWIRPMVMVLASIAASMRSVICAVSAAGKVTGPVPKRSQSAAPAASGKTRTTTKTSITPTSQRRARRGVGLACVCPVAVPCPSCVIDLVPMRPLSSPQTA